MPINASNVLTLAHQLRVYTAEAASFSDMMDVVYVAQMIQKFLGYVDQIKEVRFSGALGPLEITRPRPPTAQASAAPGPSCPCDSRPQLVEVMVDMASNLMLVDEHLLWLAQREDKACSGIVGALERIGGAALSPHAQHISVVPWASCPNQGGSGRGLRGDRGQPQPSSSRSKSKCGPAVCLIYQEPEHD